MKILIVGAGAVGGVYGHYLYRGGADVSFFVKEKYAQPLTQGITLYPLRRTSKGREEHFTEFSLLTEVSAVAEQEWDQVWFCMASDGLLTDTNAELLKSVGDASIVMLQPDLLDRAWLLQFVKEQQLVQGLISFLSYQTPLAGEIHPPAGGLAYLLFPNMYSYFSGSMERVSAVVALLNNGRMPAKVRQDLPWVSAERSAIAIPLIAGLEIEQWSIGQYRSSDTLDLACRASRQALQVAARHHKVSSSLKRHLIRPIVMGNFFSGARMYSSFSLENYLAFHFTKVGKQTRHMLHTYIELGEDMDLSVNALRYLNAQLLDENLMNEPVTQSDIS